MAESLDKQLELADVYAAALFELAREAGVIDDVRSELEELVKLLGIEPGLERFLASRAISEDQRTAGLEKMFRGKLSDAVLNTLLVMNRHGRCGFLAALLRCYVLRKEAAAGQVQTVVTSAVELSGSERAAIETVAAQISRKTPVAEYVIDPDMIGGLILQVGDWRYDNSVRRQLKTARQRLLERSERGLEVGVTE